MKKQETIKFYCSDRELTQLARNNAADAGFDIRCAEHTVTVNARERKLVSTGLYVAVPEGCVGIVKSRSGNAVKQGIEVGAGVIDAPYRGEVKVLLHNHSDKDVVFNYGDRIAQMCVIKLSDMDVEPVMSLDELGTTDRGEKGFGSSGLK